MKRKISIVVFSALCLAYQTSRAEGRGIYVDLDGGFSHINYPQNKFFAKRGESSPFTRQANLDTESGGVDGNLQGAGVGVHLPFGMAASNGARLEWRGWRMHASASNAASFMDTGAGVRYGWVMLDNSTGYGTPDGMTLDTSVKQSIDFSGNDLLFLLDYGTDKSASWAIYAGPSVKSLRQDTEIQGRIITPVTLNDSLSTDYRGVRFGAKYIHPLDEAWKASVDISGSYYRYKASYHGVYEDGAAGIQRRLRSDKDAIGCDVRLDLIRKIASNVSLSIFGGLGYLSEVPQVDYGSVPSDPAHGTLSLGSDKLLTWTLGLKLQANF